MVHNDAAKLKKIRLDKIAKAIAAGFNEGGTDYERLLIWIQFNMGLTRPRADPRILKTFSTLDSVNNECIISQNGMRAKATTINVMGNNIDEIEFGSPFLATTAQIAKIVPEVVKTSRIKERCHER